MNNIFKLQKITETVILSLVSKIVSKFENKISIKKPVFILYFFDFSLQYEYTKKPCLKCSIFSYKN